MTPSTLPMFDGDSREAARAALLDESSSDALIDAMVHVNLHRTPTAEHAAALETARSLEWIADRYQLTPLGRGVSDSLREYRFWQERGRTAHGEGKHPATSREFYRGKDVVEVGAGFGANLYGIAGSARRLVGVEPSPVYRDMSIILSAREGLEPAEMIDGLGEKLPLPDACMDVVVCYSSHQYMHMRRAFVEMARVLRPGGQLQLASGVLDQFQSIVWDDWRGGGGRGALRHLVEVTVRTVTYQTLGLRLARFGAGGTAEPMYPSLPALRRWLEQAGLRVRDDLTRRYEKDTYVFADKPRRA
jgi:SAM-dependent methyltransferase